MNFGGYVPLNRGLIEHTMTGQMTNNEALVFVWLLMLADRKTGSYTINQPTLRTFLPGLSKGAAQDALESLERKRYIYRDVKPREKLAYRYWIDGFMPTDGPHKSLQLDLSEVFAAKDTSKLRYLKSPETPPATQPETRPETPNSNKKRERDQIKETTTGSKGGERKRCMEGEDASDSHGECNGEREVSGWCADGDKTRRPDGDRIDALPPGFEIRTDGHVYDASGEKVHPTAVAALRQREVHRESA
jgi:hypothetical protein